MASTSADTSHRLRVLPSWLVGKVALHAQRLVADALAHSGLRRSHYAVLAALDEQGPLSQAELGRRVWMDRSDLHGVVNDLESEGLVARGRDPRDRRRNVVESSRRTEPPRWSSSTPRSRRRSVRCSSRCPPPSAARCARS
jgi:predicted pyridoxine 5'-phosphate oxidase superfamily flavin-nucleotide-binding protein